MIRARGGFRLLCLQIMSGKTQLRLLISVALVFFAIILLYSLFFSQPVKLYSIAATQHSSEMSQDEAAGQSTAASSAPKKDETDTPLQIDLNAATKEDLMGIDGIGGVLAARIIEYRNAHGAFRSVDELQNVEGIGDAKLEALLRVLYVS